jgi:hypothetical protein
VRIALLALVVLFCGCSATTACALGGACPRTMDPLPEGSPTMPRTPEMKFKNGRYVGTRRCEPTPRGWMCD